MGSVEDKKTRYITYMATYWPLLLSKMLQGIYIYIYYQKCIMVPGLYILGVTPHSSVEGSAQHLLEPELIKLYILWLYTVSSSGLCHLTILVPCTGVHGSVINNFGMMLMILLPLWDIFAADLCSKSVLHRFYSPPFPLKLCAKSVTLLCASRSYRGYYIRYSIRFYHDIVVSVCLLPW